MSSLRRRLFSFFSKNKATCCFSFFPLLHDKNATFFSSFSVCPAALFVLFAGAAGAGVVGFYFFEGRGAGLLLDEALETFVLVQLEVVVGGVERQLLLVQRIADAALAVVPLRVACPQVRAEESRPYILRRPVESQEEPFKSGLTSWFAQLLQR